MKCALTLLALASVSLLSSLQGKSGLAPVQITVRDSVSGERLPCRITVVDADGSLAEITPGKAVGLASRKGVIYTATGIASFTAPNGRYTVYANRGLEYSLTVRELSITQNPIKLDLALRREVDTSNHIAADTHIHTLTHSGHGDATTEERMATIAGEGIELAVATDHNHHTDYRPAMEATMTTGQFSPVVGNEVTTSVGHFNAFPIEPGSPVPDYKSTDWKRLLAGIRAVPGVKVVVLNHPSNLHSNFKPTHPARFHAHSGESLDSRDWDFDGIEVVTSAALQSDITKPLKDWFALLNSGRRMTGIGSSDTHEVNAYILGQGRTYLKSRAANPPQIDIAELCENLKGGRALISMGLFTETWVNGSIEPGGLAENLAPAVRVRVRVQGPKWIDADSVELFVNGSPALRQAISPADSRVIKLDKTFTIPRPKQDAWIIAVATGPGVDKPYWPIPRPYQPTDPNWQPRVIGATNPIWLDADGDGKYTSPAGYAKQAVDSAGGDVVRTMPALERYDESVAVQAAAALRARGANLTTARSAIDRAAPHVRHAFVAYLSVLSESKP